MDTSTEKKNKRKMDRLVHDPATDNNKSKFATLGSLIVADSK